MNNKKNTILFCLLFALLLIDILVGNTAISPKIFVDNLYGNADEIYKKILLDFRLPKACTAIIVGSALGVSGLLMQTFFRNPLAGPNILGVSAGASFGVSIFSITISSLPISLLFLNLGQIISAIIGAFFVLTIIIFASKYTKNMTSLLIIGIMTGSAVSATVCILQSLANPEQLKSYIMWTMGSLSSTTWTSIYILVPIVFICIFLSFFQVKNLNLWLLGNDYAQNLGVSIEKTRTIVLILTGILSGTITSFAGPIAFIGIAIPHISKMIFHTFDHKILLTGCVLCGAIAMLLCDIISQITPSPMPINAVTSLLGAPMVIWIILKGENL